jgi:hypothetical protein
MEEKKYWHVTPKYSVNSICRLGIRTSKNGYHGGGVIYCIEANDLHSLQILLNADVYRKRGLEFEDLSIVEFIYNGEVETRIPIELLNNYRDEKWILINHSIDKEQITKTMGSELFSDLKYEKATPKGGSSLT